jgi:hypothetical protein
MDKAILLSMEFPTGSLSLMQMVPALFGEGMDANLRGDSTPDMRLLLWRQFMKNSPICQ